ncbi:SapC family protein [Altererythrobacter fulvus]|uniref:SapC family protein n=1 Tax=Caenibius fulvus TaxID=2126012 RepID=UPI0030165887
MATAPSPNLPLFYQDLMPLNRRDHEKWRARRSDTADWLIGQHAVPLTVDEFGPAQRHFPIIFSSGNRPVPLALFGLNEGVNVYVDDKGTVSNDVYIPAYIRRYPFLLAKLDPNSEAMSLCFDPSSKLLGDFEEGDTLFEGEEPADFIKGVMQFCERFEEAGMRTQAFVDELIKHDLLMDGEVAITQDGLEQPFIYRGFKMINQEKLRDLRGDLLRTWNQNGMLALIFAHVLSLDLLRVIFARQTSLGKGPGAANAQAAN